MHALTSRDERVVRTLAQAVLTRGGAISADAIDARVVDRIDQWMATLTPTGLWKVRALFHMFDPHHPTGIKIDDEVMASLSITRDEFHGEWNYTLNPMC